MTLSKRLALLGVRSAVSVSKSRGVGSSYGLIDRRPFPYRQISNFTNDSKNSQMETLEDNSSPELIESIKNGEMKDLIDNNTEIRKRTALGEDTKIYIHIVGTTTVLLMPVFILVCLFGI